MGTTMTRRAPLDLITIAQAMKEFRVGRGTIFKALSNGVLKRYRRGGERSVYLSRGALETWRAFKEEK